MKADLFNCMYAIVDIETTGGHANANGITEIAIRIHDGTKVTERFETLINPGIKIPIFIRTLTGITDEMVERAPSFSEVASRIHSLLQGRIFVAHNVNFDYSFLRHHLHAAGFNLQSRKLCTVRLGRKILPGLPSYSLGKFCSHLGIVNTSRHRAGGDAEATAILFSRLLEADKEGHIAQSLNVRSKEQCLPANLPVHFIDQLPYTAGVYYFHDIKGKVIYVGKAKSIRKRVFSHFSNNNPGKKKQDFLRNIYSISFKECGTELMALIHEALEIRRLWPSGNRALKRNEHPYGLYQFEDQQGYKRLAIDKCRKTIPVLYTFSFILEGHELLNRLIRENNLCGRLCFVQTGNTCKTEAHQPECPVCAQRETPEKYNLRVESAVNSLKKSLPSFMIIDEGRVARERSCILVEEGKIFGAGFIPDQVMPTETEIIKSQLIPFAGNDYIRNLVYHHAEKHPEKMIMI